MGELLKPSSIVQISPAGSPILSSPKRYDEFKNRKGGPVGAKPEFRWREKL